MQTVDADAGRSRSRAVTRRVQRSREIEASACRVRDPRPRPRSCVLQSGPGSPAAGMGLASRPCSASATESRARRVSRGNAGKIRARSEVPLAPGRTRPTGAKLPLTLTPPLASITMDACVGRNAERAQFFAPSGLQEKPSDGLRDDGRAAQDPRSRHRRSHCRRRAPDLGAVDDDDQHVRRRRDARSDPSPGRGRLRDRARDRAQERRRRGRAS